MKAVLPLSLASAFALLAGGCASSPGSDMPEDDAYGASAAAETSAGTMSDYGSTGTTGTTGSTATTGTTTGTMSTTAGGQAQEPSSYRTEQIHLQELDKDGDGFLARDELEPDHKLAMEFDTYDADGDGRISEAEFHTYVEASTDE